MRAYRRETTAAFEPVILELQTQEEIDMIFCILSHAAFCRAVGFAAVSYLELSPFVKDKDTVHAKINDLLSGSNAESTQGESCPDTQ